MRTDKQRAADRRRRQRIKRDMIVLKATLDHCAKCGLVFDPERPYGHDLDHTDPATKVDNVHMVFRNRTCDDGLAEWRKCQLLCRPCHKDKTRATGQ